MSSNTPVKAKYAGASSTKHSSAAQTRENARASAQIVEVEDFESRYLRKEVVEMSSRWPKIRQNIMDQLSQKLEAVNYPLLCEMLTRIGLAVSKPKKDSDPCLVFCITANLGCLGKIEGTHMRPDISSIMSTRKQARQVVQTGIFDGRVRWNQLMSLGEVKAKPDNTTNIQAASYLQILARARPDLAGMLYMSWEHKFFRLYWSDTSGIIGSYPYYFSDETSWSILLRYVRSIWDPLPLLPTRDRTMDLLPEDGSPKPKWSIRTKQREFSGTLMFATPSHGRQTCVFHDAAANRVIKDHWCDMHRRFREATILENIKGVPGVVQVDFSEVVMMDAEGTEVPLTTNEMHSGTDTVIKTEYGDRIAPRREKQRSVLKSIGRPLTERTSVLELILALFDSLQGHRLCLGKKRTLHRDISENNILINPVHHDTKLDDYPDVKFIRQILDPSNTEVDEAGMLIDWDNAAKLDELGEANPLTNRTGTPMFVACAVASGVLIRDADRRSEFPEITGEAKELYLKAYGPEKYEFYLNAINNTPSMQSIPIDANPAVEHCGCHDVESAYWVLVHQLLHAWPVNEESQVSEKASRLMNVFKSHTFVEEDTDSRDGVFRNKREESWLEILHPRLAILCKMMALLTRYIATEWALWKEYDLPEDHCHEAMSRLLLEVAVPLKVDPIALLLKPRQPLVSVGVANVGGAKNYSNASGSLSKRTRDKEDGTEAPPTSKRTKTSVGESEAQVIPRTEQKDRGFSSKGRRDAPIPNGKAAEPGCSDGSGSMPPPSHVPVRRRSTRNSAKTIHGQSVASGSRTGDAGRQSDPES
ncbi:hypothetical protein M0805_000713 [Coniferiporia weirii]|nr:hypothetical protein M0805_000713 [Coniferiporia weirii]